MSRKQILEIKQREESQKKLKKYILQLIRKVGIVAAEYQVDHLSKFPQKQQYLPTSMNWRETVREYQLTIKEYKKELEEKKIESIQIEIKIN